MKTIPCATAIMLTAEERTALEVLSRSAKSEFRMRTRAQIVLLAAGGTPTREIGRIVGCTTGTASKWRVRYARDRLAGLDEAGHRGAEAKYGVAEQQRILVLLDQPLPAGYANSPKRFAFAAGTAPLLARALVDVHEQYIWRFLRAQKIDLSGRKSWCESNDLRRICAAVVAPRDERRLRVRDFAERGNGVLAAREACRVCFIPKLVDQNLCGRRPRSRGRSMLSADQG